MTGLSPNNGGVETYIINLLRHIDREKFKLYFICRGEVAYKNEVLGLGGHLIQTDISRHTPLKYVKFMNGIFDKYRFDAVYYNTCDIMSIDILRFAKKHGVPARIIHSHTSQFWDKPNLPHQITEKWCKDHLDEYATKLLACSETAGKWMYGGRRFEVVNNGIDTDKFAFSPNERRAVRSKLGIENKLAVGFVGRLWKQKNPLFLIDVFSEVLEREANSVLLIVGDGEMRRAMEEKAAGFKIADKVIFLGVRNDIPRLMSAMDRFVLPSIFEGLPFVLVEAQAAGLPCTVSENVSKESNICGEAEYLSLECEKGVWADTIINHKLRGERGEYAEIVREKGYDIKQTVKRIETLLDE